MGSRSVDSRVRRRFLLELLVVLVLLVGFSILVRAFDLDLLVSGWFHRPAETPEWWAKDRQPWQALYDFGTWPANGVGILAALGLLLSLVRPVLRRYRRTLFFLLLTLVLGPGVLVNMGFKDHWGRPRPRNIMEFGGVETFQPVGERGLAGRGKAFPSGHAAMGFYFVGMYILWRNRHPRAARAGLVGGLLVGGLIGFQRIAVGGHFLTDVVWAGGFVVLTGLCIDAALPKERPGHEPERVVNRWILAAIGAGIVAAAVFATPSYRRAQTVLGPFPSDTVARIRWLPVQPDSPRETNAVVDGGRYLVVRNHVQGYGYFESEVGQTLESGWSDDTLAVTLCVRTDGFFTRLRSWGSYEIVVAPPEESFPIPVDNRPSASPGSSR
jgi:membrane-associated PAP2 superfamily phosphatase